MADPFSLSEWSVVLIAAAAASVVGFLLGRRALGEIQRAAQRLTAEIARLEGQSREQTRLASKMRNEQRSLTNLSRSLPGLVRELNNSYLDPNDIPKHLFDLTEKIFEPQQMLLFLVRSPGEEVANLQEIYLRDQRGLGEIPATATRVRIGEGKIGWVAENKVEMMGEDWLNLSRTDGRNVEGNHPAFRLSLVGPLVHHGENQDYLIGVLCVGDPAIRPRDEKLVLQMITNLGSIAYRNVRNVRALREQANHDGLTGLVNKRHFMKSLGILIDAAGRRAQPLAVFMFDIDHFKRYNDSNGHQAGDEILRGVADVLRRSLRPQDLAGRYGGEEFIVAMPLTDGTQAFQAAERIRDAIATHPFAHRETQPDGVLSISGGVAVFPVDGQNSTDLIRHADQALYKAKADGRNRVARHKGFDIGDADVDALGSRPEPTARRSPAGRPAR
ncbi:MAG: GGDEF domain-containing protein [Acidobacteriia bacterium]|nr:GGDEF domain-containing protein [Terriglobia bacterium]